MYLELVPDPTPRGGGGPNVSVETREGTVDSETRKVTRTDSERSLGVREVLLRSRRPVMGGRVLSRRAAAHQVSLRFGDRRDKRRVLSALRTVLDSTSRLRDLGTLVGAATSRAQRRVHARYMGLARQMIRRRYEEAFAKATQPRWHEHLTPPPSRTVTAAGIDVSLVRDGLLATVYRCTGLRNCGTAADPSDPKVVVLVQRPLANSKPLQFATPHISDVRQPSHALTRPLAACHA